MRRQRRAPAIRPVRIEGVQFREGDGPVARGQDQRLTVQRPQPFRQRLKRGRLHGVGLVQDDHVRPCRLRPADARNVPFRMAQIKGVRHRDHKAGLHDVAQLGQRFHDVGGVRQPRSFQYELLGGHVPDEPQQPRTQAVRQRTAHAPLIKRLHLGFAAQKRRVKPDFSEFILDDARIALTPVQEIQPLPQECGFARAEKAGEDVQHGQAGFLLKRLVAQGQAGEGTPLAPALPNAAVSRSSRPVPPGMCRMFPAASKPGIGAASPSSDTRRGPQAGFRPWPTRPRTGAGAAGRAGTSVSQPPGSTSQRCPPEKVATPSSAAMRRRAGADRVRDSPEPSTAARSETVPIRNGESVSACSESARMRSP